MQDTFQIEQPPKRRSPMPFVLLGCGGVFLLSIVACGGFMYWGFTQADATVSPEVDALFASIESGEFADTYRTKTTPAFRSNVGPQQYELLGDAVREHLGPLKSKSARGFNWQTNDNGTFGEVTYTATFAKGEATVFVRYRQQGERWLLDELTIDSPQVNEHLSAGVCPHCSASLSAADKFCPNCGEAVEGGSTPTGKGANPTADAPRAKDDSRSKATVKDNDPQG